MEIIVVNGYPESGKDTFVNFCRDIVGEAYCKNISTVDFVKYIAAKCGWDGTKTAKNRKFLSDMKNLLTEWNDVPFQKVKKEIDFFRRDLESYGVDKYGIVFIHCREPEEIERFEKELGAKSVFIDREESKREQSNHSDSRVENHSYTYKIDNNENLEHLREGAKTFIKILRGELKIDFSV
jgi:dephospho-CoA kinase